MKALNSMLFAVLFVVILVSAIAPSLAIKAGASVLFLAALLLSAWMSRKAAR